MVFRSTDHWSIPTGVGHRKTVIGALRSAKVYVLLLSKYSAVRPWVNFEAGFAESMSRRIFGLLTRGTKPSEVPSPLQELQLRPLDENVLNEILSAIQGLTGRVLNQVNPTDFLARLRNVEAKMGDWDPQRKKIQTRRRPSSPSVTCLQILHLSLHAGREGRLRRHDEAQEPAHLGSTPAGATPWTWLRKNRAESDPRRHSFRGYGRCKYHRLPVSRESADGWFSGSRRDVSCDLV